MSPPTPRAARIAAALTLLACLACDRPTDRATAAAPAAALAAPTRPAVADPADWCAGHALPESMCTKCNPSLIPAFQAAGDWCPEHGLPESVCPLCNPLPPPAAPSAPDPADWCAEHGLPESKCTLCNPGLTAAFKAAGDWCPEHGLPESVCPQCNPIQPPPGATPNGPIAPGTRIRLRDPAHEAAAGIETAPATAAALAATLETTARIDFDRDALADVRAPVPGIVAAMHVDLGDPVTEGDPLFTLQSPAIGDLQARRTAARAALDAARAELTRQRTLRADNLTAQSQLDAAREALAAATAELRSIEHSLALSGARADAGRYVVTAPLTGRVVRRPAVLGAHATEADPLALIADTTRMWALIDLPERDAAAVPPGAPVEVRVDGLPAPFTGRVTWIAPEVDPHHRAVTARAALHNPDGHLRAGQVARARVTLAAPHDAVAVPAEAIQRLGDAAVVFIREAPGLYVPRVIQPGRSDGRRVQLTGDLHPGDPVVTTGAYLLRTELTRESIGAGCCEIDPPGGD
ncbi:MAG: efflux RND transporter periplasmic adaptor subunit [bacterium]